MKAPASTLVIELIWSISFFKIGPFTFKERADIVNKLHEIDNGRWYGMGLSEHIGFNHWCEEECSYPIVHTLKPGNKPRVIEVMYS